LPIVGYGHLNRGMESVFEVVLGIGRGLILIAEVHAMSPARTLRE